MNCLRIHFLHKVLLFFLEHGSVETTLRMAGYTLGQKHFGSKHMMGAKLAAIKHLLGGKAIHPMVQHMMHQGHMGMMPATTLSGMKRGPDSALSRDME